MSDGSDHTLSAFSAADAVVVVAPHPDDELIAAGVLIQHAVAAGAQVYVVLVTHGDAYGTAPTPRQSARGPVGRRINLGNRRRNETVRAVGMLGVPPEDVVSLGYPDRGVAALWSDYWDPGRRYRSPFSLADTSPYEELFTPGAEHTGSQLHSDMIALLRKFRPTHVVYPHPKDAHGDHAACSAFVTSALETLARSGADWVGRCSRHLYLVHRGGWPGPRGYDPARRLEPPASILALGESWQELMASEEQIERKRAAVRMYRSQFPLVGRFLLSFVRRNEVFSKPAYPQVKSLSRGAVLVGAGGEPMATEPLIRDPVRDTVTRQVERSGDVASINLARDGGTLYVHIGLMRRPAHDVEYRLSLFPCPREGGVVLRLRPPYRATLRSEGTWKPARDVVVRPSGSALEVAVPMTRLSLADGLFVSVETRSRGIAIDRTGFHYVRVDDVEREDPAVSYAVASPADVSACAHIFTEAFRESILHVFGHIPQHRIVRQVFRLCYEADPQALLVAMSEGRVKGYVYAPTSMRPVWRTALLGGHVLRWVSAWAKGQMRLGWGPLRVLLLDKFHFMRSSVGADLTTEARILSIAVSQEMQGHGIGTQLVEHALRRFARLGVARVRLEVRPGNISALRVYQKLGFREAGTTKDSQGEWVIMHVEM